MRCLLLLSLDTITEVCYTSIVEEIWRSVVGFENVYSVSNLGRVRRDGASRGAKLGRIPRPSQNTHGYPFVSLSRDNQARTYCIHCLVTQAFLGPAPPGFEVNHQDLNKSNSCLDNLEYVT